MGKKDVSAPELNKDSFGVDKDNNLFLGIADTKEDYRFKGKCDASTGDIYVKIPGFTVQKPNDNGGSTPISLNDWQKVMDVANPGSVVDCERGIFEFTLRIPKAGGMFKEKDKPTFALRGKGSSGDTDIMEIPLVKATPLFLEADAPLKKGFANHYYIPQNDVKGIELKAKGGLPPYEYRLLASFVAGLPKNGRFECMLYGNICRQVGEKVMGFRAVDSVLQTQDIYVDIVPKVSAKVLMPGSTTKVLLDSEKTEDMSLKIPAGSNLRIQASAGVPNVADNPIAAYDYAAKGPGFFIESDPSLYRTSREKYHGEPIQDVVSVYDGRGNHVSMRIEITGPLEIFVEGSSKARRGDDIIIKATGGKSPYIFSVEPVDGQSAGDITPDPKNPALAHFKASKALKQGFSPTIRVVDDLGGSDKIAKGSPKELFVE